MVQVARRVEPQVGVREATDLKPVGRGPRSLGRNLVLAECALLDDDLASRSGRLDLGRPNLLLGSVAAVGPCREEDACVSGKADVVSVLVARVGSAGRLVGFAARD